MVHPPLVELVGPRFFTLSSLPVGLIGLFKLLWPASVPSALCRYHTFRNSFANHFCRRRGIAARRIFPKRLRRLQHQLKPHHRSHCFETISIGVINAGMLIAQRRTSVCPLSIIVYFLVTEKMYVTDTLRRLDFTGILSSLYLPH